MAESSYNGGDEETKGRGQSFNESFNEKFGEFRKFASTNFTRAKQYTIEKMGKAEGVTTFDTEYETLSQQLEAIKISTEKIVVHVQSLIQPHPGVRLEENIYNRLDKPKPHRSETEEMLGAEFGKASSAFGMDAPEYGSYLRQCGAAEVKMGQALLLYHNRVQKEFLTPLRAFLEVDVKNVLREKKILSVKRLDLDAAKARTRKASGDRLMQVEMELRVAQAEFDAQLSKVRDGTKKAIQTHIHYMGYLKSFMGAQKEYHQQCLSQLESIDTEELAAPGRPPRPPQYRTGGGGGGGEEELTKLKSGKFVVNGIELDGDDTRNAKVLYDYEAVNEEELTVYCEEEIKVTPVPGDDEYVMAESKGKFGKIPSTYVELL